MKKYQVVEISGAENHAGTKATADCAVIAQRLGFEQLYLKMATTKDSKLAKVQRQIAYLKEWAAIEKKIEPNSVVLLQEPFHYGQLTREKTLTRIKQKNVRFISVIHDVEELRKFRYNDYYREEFDFMLKTVDIFIVHNEKMKQFFLNKGVAENRLVCLGIFDYLQLKPNEKKPSFAPSITVAGNLDVTKCGYISQLNEIGVKVNLFGPNFSETMKNHENVVYHGSFPSDEIPKHLTEGFGLVWDGSSIHGCQGDSGQYLRYNNPHKLSLYLSSGLPVVIWKEAAEADYVRNHQVGLCINDLSDLQTIFSQMDEVSYDILCGHVSDVKTDLLQGNYFRHALSEALKRV